MVKKKTALATIPPLSEYQIRCFERAAKRARMNATKAELLRRQLEKPDTVEAREYLLCGLSPEYFINSYCQIYDATIGTWVPFQLWPEQVDVLDVFHTKPQVIVLKARQLGLSWLADGYALWQMIFTPVASVLIFSKRDDESIYLLGDERLRGMYKKLPAFIRLAAGGISVSSARQFTLGNGSTARAFPTTAGDSYTASLVIMDEADLIENFDDLMRSVKPTRDAGGKLFLISRADKKRPMSSFKKIYREAKKGTNGWTACFLPWYVRPARTLEWYAEIKREVLSRTGSLDELWEQYPETDEQALAPRTLDKRLAPEWLLKCYQKLDPQNDELEGCPSIPGLAVYAAPEQAKSYVIGCDPAEGNPTSDDSAATVLRADTGEEVALLRGKFQPSTFAAHLDRLGSYFNDAVLLVERNNHGHAVIGWLLDNSNLTLLDGPDERAGWVQSSLGKTKMYDLAADAFRFQGTLIHSEDTYIQLTAIDGSTLSAPPGEMDDLATSYALALAGQLISPALPFTMGRADWGDDE